MMAVQLSADQGPILAQAFSRSRLLLDRPPGEGALRPVAWTAFGGRVALLGARAVSLSLERFDPTANRTAATPWGDHVVLADGIKPSRLDALICPPLACRTGTALVSEDECLFFPHPEARRPDPPQPTTWSALGEGQIILAAGLSPAGDLYLAATGGGSVIVRDPQGEAVAVFDDGALGAEPAVGLLVQGRGRELVFYLWAAGRVRWRAAGDGLGAEAAETSMPGLLAPARRWRERLAGRSTTPAPWHGWREAEVGVYPMLSGEPSRWATRAPLSGWTTFRPTSSASSTPC